LFKTDAARDLVSAVKAVQGDATFFTEKVAEAVLNGFKHNGSRTDAGRLTPRQREITKLLAEGRTTKEVGAFLGISVKTAETHRSNLMHRLNCYSAAELVRYAVRNQIIDA
jgi:DNA-binding NarL/FixJ family response regulator